MKTDHAQFWDILEKTSICMVTTEDDGLFRARPMAPYIDADAKTIRFMTDAASAKVFEVAANKNIGLTFADQGSMVFASVSAKGVVSYEKDLIKKLWGPYAQVFFGSDPESADVAILTAEPERAEFWDNSGSKIAMAFELTRAYFSDGGPNLGTNAKLELS